MLPPTMSRLVRHRYADPLDLIWVACAHECGLLLARSSEVFASYDGAGTLTVSTPAHFDADDSLAQLIFHELCHGLVAGPAGLKLRDWGLENLCERDLVQEHACNRLQCALATQFGLRRLFAVTTEHRAYWDGLPADPLAQGDDPAIPLAQQAWDRARRGPWAAALQRALGATRDLREALAGIALPENSIWRSGTEVELKSGVPKENAADE